MESITRHYELVLMFDINQDESMTTSTLDKYKSVITENSGSIHRFEDWGKITFFKIFMCKLSVNSAK